ncbi:MAG: dodecin domain-containing protein [Planctomycetota bacterium]|nr:MAG: dodecin domain-containing protein [Planctomycetota bacterium]
MTHEGVAKVVQIVSNSDKSFDDAISKGVASAARTLRGISGVKVTDWTASVANDKVSDYKVTMDVAFAIEE